MAQRIFGQLRPGRFLAQLARRSRTELGKILGPIQIDQESSRTTMMMWKGVDTVRTSPAIQCHVTHANLIPTIGRNP